MTTVAAEPVISRHQAIALAEADALPMYGTYLHILVLEIALHEDGWHLDYSPRPQGFRTGGGPQYVIDSRTGEIVSKKYYQKPAHCFTTIKVTRTHERASCCPIEVHN
jgi:hypothetical protein